MEILLFRIVRILRNRSGKVIFLRTTFTKISKKYYYKIRRRLIFLIKIPL